MLVRFVLFNFCFKNKINFSRNGERERERLEAKLISLIDARAHLGHEGGGDLTSVHEREGGYH